MLVIYRFFIFLYAVVLHIASWFKPKAKLFLEGRKGLLLRIKAQMGNENRPRIWMHCSSLGEFEQGRPVIESLRASYPNYAIVISFFSPSGYQVQRKYKGADYVFYLPLDTASNAKQFVRDINPTVAIFVKYDLWYYFLSELHKRNVPTILISAIFRPNQAFFKWYGGIQRKMLHLITHIFVQNEASQHLLEQIGINRVSVAGDTRFDRVLSVAQKSKTMEQMEHLCQKYKLIIAGSTWAEDEQMLAQILPQLPPQWKLIIVPHEVDEARISSVEKLFSGRIKRWSNWQKDNHLDKQVLVVDTIGILLKLYRYGSIAWIGGGLAAGGVHNVLEAAVYGLPCAYGPVFEKYQEAVGLINCGAAVVCSDSTAFNNLVQLLIQDKEMMQQMSDAAKNYVAAQCGASDKIVHYFEEKNWLSTL